MSLRALSIAVAVALALSGCANRTVRIQSAAAPPPAASMPAEQDPLLPQDPMASEPETPVAVDTTTEPETAENYAQLAAATVEAAPGGESPYLLDSGDRIRVFVYGQPNLTRTYPIDGAGFISMPLIGSVKARGLTTYDLGSTITTLLGTDYVRDPEVAVEVVGYRPFSIIGEVRNAGQFPFQPAMTVETAVAVAGGFTPRAQQNSFEITRMIDGAPTRFEASPYESVRPGDTIRVYERFF
ncbi:MAG: polysaccharide biosynthesis/export family protein [Hyphomicrobiaceae bacterium]